MTEPFTVTRSDGAICLLRICEDAAPDQTLWECIVPNKPAYASSLFGSRQEVEPQWVAFPVDDMLRTLTEEEGKALMGYCAHMVEHGTTHIAELVSAMAAAMADRRFDAVRSLNEELDTVLTIREIAGRTARLVYEAGEVS